MHETPWISINDALPPLGVFVLVHLTIDNWRSSSDQAGVNFVVAKREMDGNGGNNLKPYRWSQFGPTYHFGQDVDFWMPIPRDDRAGARNRGLTLFSFDTNSVP